jgi:hypothetical protein
MPAGEHLPLDQSEILERGPLGHSFEARLYAENVHRNFLPGVTSSWVRLVETAFQMQPPQKGTLHHDDVASVAWFCARGLFQLCKHSVLHARDKEGKLKGVLLLHPLPFCFLP